MTEKILVFVITANILLAGFGNKQNTAQTAGAKMDGGVDHAPD